MCIEFEIRKDFKSIEDEIYKLIKYGEIFHSIRKEYGRLKNNEDFEEIYILEGRAKRPLEQLYSSGGDSSWNIRNTLSNINDFHFYPTLTQVIKDLDDIELWKNELQQTLQNAETQYKHLNLSLYSISKMFKLHKQQLEYLTNISTITSILKNSDIFKKENNIMLFSDNNFNYDKLRDDLIEISLLETKNRNAISKESEDETNDRFRTALSNRKYNVTDQSRGGESESGKNAGERDLVICNSQGIDESVIEAFILSSLSSTVIDKHYEKLVKRYDTVGNRVNFVLVYSKTKNFDDLWEKYVNYDKFDNFVDTEDKYSQKDNVRVGVSEYGKMTIYHLFINFYSHGGD